MTLIKRVYSVLENDSSEVCVQLFGALERVVVVTLITDTLETDTAFPGNKLS